MVARQIIKIKGKELKVEYNVDLKDINWDTVLDDPKYEIVEQEHYIQIKERKRGNEI